MKILLIDLETAPSLGYVWGRWEQDVIEFKQDWYILSFSAKWLDSKRVFSSSLNQYPLFKKEKENDREVVERLWALLDEADVVIAHNGDAFDIRKANARFIYHGMKPPSPYKTVDTLKVARKYFKFDSNKLDDVSRYLKIGRKKSTTGFHLWKGCMMGDPQAWRQLVAYNKQDVILLEKLYLRVRGWMTNHPTVSFGSCPTCQSPKVQRRGYVITRLFKIPRLQCQTCGLWFVNKHEKEKIQNWSSKR